MPLKQTLSRHWFRFQPRAVPLAGGDPGSPGRALRAAVRVVELARVEESLPYSRGWRGRPLKDRAALARAFLAKAVLDVPTTVGGWSSGWDGTYTNWPPVRLGGGGLSERGTFSRAFAEFAAATCRGTCMRRCSTER